MNKYILIVAIGFLSLNSLLGQIITREDSLSAGLVATNSTTVISGYGNVKYSNNLTERRASANVDRLVLFVGHRFNKKITFFSELEIEDAKISGGEVGGEFAIEQAFLKFDINHFNYITAGLFIPRIGVINENHLPTTFNGNDRPFVEQFIIPATWREIGIGYYGTSIRIPGLNYTLALMNGLNSAGFESGSGIRGGRYEGSGANASCLALNGSLLYFKSHFRIQLSGYLGGSAGLTKQEADSLQLDYGSFGTPVELIEANVQYRNKGFVVKALASLVNISNAFEINRAYANTTPEQILGYYGEIGYNLLHKTDKNFTLFARYENLNLNLKLPENGIENKVLNQQYLVTGISFQPHKGVIVKADYFYRLTGDQNQALIVNPSPQSQPFFKQQHYFNLGIGYSF